MALTGYDIEATTLGWSTNNPTSADAFYSNPQQLSNSTVSAVALGPYAVAIAGHEYPIDTSFEPYRREAFRHRTVPAQRQSINFSNIQGEGTVNSEGLWRREQNDWTAGAGQQFLDSKGASMENRFYRSKGLDVFTKPYQVQLLNDTEKYYPTSGSPSTSTLLCSRSGANVYIVDGASVKYTPDWSSFTTCSFTTFTPASNTITNATYASGVITYTTGTAHNYAAGYHVTTSGIVNSGSSATTVFNLTNATITGVTATTFTVSASISGTPVFVSNGTVTSVTTFAAPSTITSIDTNDTYVFIASNTGIWYTTTGSTTFTLFVAPEMSGSYTGGFDFVRWANDQLIASRNAKLYAFLSTHFIGGTPTGTGGDTLYVHANPNWVWSDAAGGATQVYFTGYVSNGTSNYSGCVYRSDMQSSSTTITSGVTSVTSSSVVQQFLLNTPVQALPMSPDEYPTCIQSYLNFIFVGTNKGIRMCQTLSIYDPTATATGDLKSGPLIPNLLQPVSNPVYGIVGDGRFIWFTWSNYDNTSTGLGKLDLSTFINGDPLTPVYASDLMVTVSSTSSTTVIKSLDWDPIRQTPMFCVPGYGVYGMDTTHYVSSGTLQSGIYSYGIPDKKIPVFFDYGCAVPLGTSVQASIIVDEHDPDFQGPIILAPIIGNAETEVAINSTYRGENLSTTIAVYSDSTKALSPIMYRWTTKSWPAVASETSISAVIQLFSTNVIDGLEQFIDPYAEYTYLDEIRRNQQIVTYQEGSLVANVIIESLDWLPHKRRDNYENGFEGDCVVTMKTIGGYVYTPALTV